MKKIIFLGDSIFDNHLYVSRGQSLIEQFNQSSNLDWQVELLAVDGDLTSSPS